LSFIFLTRLDINMPQTDDDTILEESLDPQDWEAFRRVAHTALDEAVDYIRDVRQRPVWRPVPEAVKQRLREPMPQAPQAVEKTYGEFRDLILPYATGNIHPRFWGWVHGSGLATGIISAMLGAAMNSNCGGRDHGALYVERQVIEWCRQMVGYPNAATGLLVSGTSMAAVIGLAVARNARAGYDVRARGIGCSSEVLVTYASSEVHGSMVKALELLGLGRDSFHAVPVDETFAIDLVALRRAIQEDRRAGRQPFCIVGCAGTVNTGGTDDLAALAEICREEGLWFHVDAAFGALCGLSEVLRPLLHGIEKSDSVAFDFHKWMHVEYDAGCVLVRDGRLHSEAFATQPDYLQHSDRALAGGGEWFNDLGPELSRSFRALKIWFALKTYGATGFAQVVENNCRQAKYLASLVKANQPLELLAEPTLNIVCFRHHAPGLSEKELDQLNRDIVADLQERGIAAPSTTRIKGKLSIRVAITNHRSRREDFDLLVESVIAIAEERVGSQAV
jgi:glutamate/tyrosine decarboxylase-like PLP-dependent enzyme